MQTTKFLMFNLKYYDLVKVKFHLFGFLLAESSFTSLDWMKILSFVEQLLFPNLVNQLF